MKLIIKRSKISGLGLFAGESIGWGKRVIEYTGEKISNKEAARRLRFNATIGVTYIFELDKKYSIDGLVGGNEARFINHSSKNPNCTAIRTNGKIFIVSYDDIKKGAELTFDYGFDPKK
jgi:SET domain-containing protein